MNLTAEDKLILAASKLHPSEKDFLRISELIPEIRQWKKFTDIAIQNSVGPLIYKNFSLPVYTYPIPEESILKFKQTYYRTLSCNIILYEHFRKAVEAFTNEGIPVIALKGIYFADALYKDIGLRQMSDVDLLLKDEDAEKCWKILLNKGYKFINHKKTNFIEGYNEVKHLPSLIMNGAAIELHTKIFLNHYGFSVNMDDCWKKSTETTLNEIKVRILSPEHQVHHTCMHMEEHYRIRKPQLFNFIDLTELINKHYSDIDWQYLEDSCQSYKCTDVVYKYLFLANKYFDLKLPESVLKTSATSIDERTEKLFIHYILNFNRNLPLSFSNHEYSDLKNIRGFRNKFQYLVEDIFPSKEFMYTRYKIRKKNYVYWYYLVRIKTGTGRLFINMIKKITASSKSLKNRN